MTHCKHFIVLIFAVFAVTPGLCPAQQTRPADVPTTAPATDFSHTWLVHLPGIGGEMFIDRAFVRGLKDGGWAGQVDIYDWTENDPGLAALVSRARNEREAEKVAGMIVDKLKQDPKLQITVTAHSGGTGIATWALEKLPADVHVQTLVLMASALSPDYDLSKALKHVRGKAFAIYSENDTLVLGKGTQAFGTIDGKKTPAAGLVGFKTPADGDKALYAKLEQHPWVKDWAAFDNSGSHIGCMARSFVEHILSPWIMEGCCDHAKEPGAPR